MPVNAVGALEVALTFSEGEVRSYREDHTEVGTCTRGVCSTVLSTIYTCTTCR